MAEKQIDSNDSYSLLSKNIKALREQFGESQEELALILDLKSKSTICQYENGTRIPNLIVAGRIAEHYRISCDDLIHRDFSNAVFYENEEYCAKDHYSDLTKMFPLATPDESSADSFFINGFKAHQLFYNRINEHQSISGLHFDSIMNNYTKSENKIVVINILALYMLLKVILDKQDYNINTDANYNTQQILRERYLYDPYSDYVFDMDKEETFSNEEINPILTELLEFAHELVEYRDLYEYYISLKFIFNITDNDIGREACARVGEIIMRELANTGNTYASQFFNIKIWKVHGMWTTNTK